ncbi:MAG: tyrosine-type recombinase/integrase [Acutalibacteraceae bacterium]|nr:tyrosine-type recombinase/integrase [Acutalibacteraceae bacterium]
MATTRKDLRGRTLQKGEMQRSSDKRYAYCYTDPLGRRKYIYANDLVTLREKEAELIKNQLDGLDIYVAGKATVNFVFDRYIKLKNNLRNTTKSNYLYMYDRFVRNTFGNKKIADIKFSDVIQFYNCLLEEHDIQINTLETIHTLLHPTFQLAVRDDIIRNNPTDGVMAELKKNTSFVTSVRHALTIPQQRAFMEHIANHPVYFHWWPMFTILLGTGCRIGEALGLRWEDLDYEKRVISINHSLVYYPVGESRTSTLHVSKPKTKSGERTIPMLDSVKDAFEMLWEEQKENGWNDVEVDGMRGFIFCNRYGNVPNPQSVNRAIKRIISDYNAIEEIRARKEKREAVILPDFSAHHLRHTFCTRLCEQETNLKVIQSIMGHKDIKTTMEIYAEATEEKKQESFERLAATLNVF